MRYALEMKAHAAQAGAITGTDGALRALHGSRLWIKTGLCAILASENSYRIRSRLPDCPEQRIAHYHSSWSISTVLTASSKAISLSEITMGRASKWQNVPKIVPALRDSGRPK